MAPHSDEEAVPPEREEEPTPSSEGRKAGVEAERAAEVELGGGGSLDMDETVACTDGARNCDAKMGL